jgi:hypothetical protein
MHDHTTGEFSNEVIKCVTEKLILCFNEVVGISTDGAQEMVGRSNGTAERNKRSPGSQMGKYHPTYHTGSFHAKDH